MKNGQNKDLTSYIESVREWYHTALMSFTLYQELMIKRAPNQVGKKQHKKT